MKFVFHSGVGHQVIEAHLSNILYFATAEYHEFSLFVVLKATKWRPISQQALVDISVDSVSGRRRLGRHAPSVVTFILNLFKTRPSSSSSRKTWVVVNGHAFPQFQPSARSKSMKTSLRPPGRVTTKAPIFTFKDKHGFG